MINELAQELLTAMIAGLAPSKGGPPAQQFIGHGVVSWDECECGMLWVRLNRVFLLSATLLEEGMLPVSCTDHPAAEFEVGVTRCAANPTNNGLPTVAAIQSAAEVANDDAERLLLAAKAQADDWRERYYVDTILTAWLPTGPEGGCQGGVMTVIVELPNPGVV